MDGIAPDRYGCPGYRGPTGDRQTVKQDDAALANRNFQTVPKWSEILPLLPRAIEVARTFGRKEIERDQAVIAILRGYRQLIGRPPTAKPAEAFIAGVEACYRNLLPRKGLNVSSSKKTLQRLIRAAT